MASPYRGIQLIGILATILLAGLSGGVSSISPTNLTTSPTTSPSTTKVTTVTPTAPAASKSTAADSTESKTTAILSTDMVTQTDMTTQLITDDLTTTRAIATTEEPFQYGEWTVKAGGSDCMKMWFGGSLMLDEEEIMIQPDASSDDSKCADNIAVFDLKQQFGMNGSLEIKMEFNKYEQTYKLTRLNFTLTEVIDVPGTVYTVIVIAGDRTFDFFEAPVGDYYSCDKEEKVDLASLILTFKFKKIQPFVKATKGKDYGGEYNCNDPIPNNSPHKRVGLIVTMSLLAVLIIAVGCFLLFRKRSTYKRFSNGV